MSQVSYRTELLTADFMNKLAKADAATETARQSLAMNPDFTVEKAFNRLDKRALGNFSWVELQE